MLKDVRCTLKLSYGCFNVGQYLEITFVFLRAPEKSLLMNTLVQFGDFNVLSHENFQRKGGSDFTLRGLV